MGRREYLTFKNETIIKKLVIFILMVVGFQISAMEFNRKFHFASFTEASQSKNYLKFIIKSTKFGMITSDVIGFVKYFHFIGNIDNGQFRGGSFSFPIKQMDTDNESRNKKMHLDCLDFKNFKNISIFTKETIPLNGPQRKVLGHITVRGVSHTISIAIKNSKIGDKVLVEGTSKLSFKKLNIPDPSILIASVNDEISVEFKLELIP